MAGICFGFGGLTATVIFAHKTNLSGYAAVRQLAVRDDSFGFCIGIGGVLADSDRADLVAYANENGMTWTDNETCC